MMLAELVGGVEEDHFEIEDALEKQLGARPMPFPGMDSTYNSNLAFMEVNAYGRIDPSSQNLGTFVAPDLPFCLGIGMIFPRISL